MQKIVINSCFGGFSLSELAYKQLGLRSGYDEIERTDPRLIQVVESLGEAANGGFAYLKIVEVPDDVQWTIEEYDGSEKVSENHRVWE